MKQLRTDGCLSITQLWRSGVLPARDGLYHSDGRSFDLRVEAFPKPSITVGERFDLGLMMQTTPDNITEYDITFELPLDGGEWICAGEASHGSEGFFSHLAPSRELVWVVYNEESNPYYKARTRTGTEIEVFSSAGFSLIVDVNAPLAMYISRT